MHQENMSASKDLEYWEGMLHGDEKAFGNLYQLYFKLLYNYGRKICSDVSKVEDSIHDLFVDLWRYRYNLSSTTSVRFYLYRSLRRRLVRDKDHTLSFSDDESFFEGVLQLASPSRESEIIQHEATDSRVRQLKKLMNDLSPRQYEALVLFFYDEFSYSEIASILDVNEQSARNLVQRGLIHLREYGKHIVSLILFLLGFLA